MIRMIFSQPACVVDDFVVIADLHLGIEVEISSKGLRLPSRTLAAAERVNQLLHIANSHTLVVLGDLKHEIPTASRYEIEEVRRFLSAVDADVILVKGNHDSLMEKLFPELRVVKELKIGDVVLAHGHSTISEKGEKYLIGHTHPAVELADGIGRTKEKVWLKLKPSEKGVDILGDCEVVVMPAFSEFVTGVAVNSPSRLPGVVFSQGLVNLEEAGVYLLDSTYLGELKELKIKE